MRLDQRDDAEKRRKDREEEKAKAGKVFEKQGEMAQTEAINRHFGTTDWRYYQA